MYSLKPLKRMNTNTRLCIKIEVKKMQITYTYRLTATQAVSDGMHTIHDTNFTKSL